MQRLASRAVADLVPARGAVGDDEGVGRRPHRRQQAQLPHAQGHVGGFRLVAEGAGHAAAARLDRVHRQVRDEPNDPLHRRQRAEALLVAVAVQHRLAFGQGMKVEMEAPGLRLTRQELFEQQGAPGHAPGVLARQQRQRLVAEGEEAGGLQPDHRHAGGDVGEQGVERAADLGAGLVHHADRQVRAAAAQRPRRAVGGAGQVHAVAAGHQHAQGGVQGLPIEGAVERVGEQHHGTAALGSDHQLAGLEPVGAPRRQ